MFDYGHYLPWWCPGGRAPAARLVVPGLFYQSALINKSKSRWTHTTRTHAYNSCAGQRQTPEAVNLDSILLTTTNGVRVPGCTAHTANCLTFFFRVFAGRFSGILHAKKRRKKWRSGGYLMCAANTNTVCNITKNEALKQTRFETPKRAEAFNRRNEQNFYRKTFLIRTQSSNP